MLPNVVRSGIAPRGLDLGNLKMDTKAQRYLSLGRTAKAINEFIAKSLRRVNSFSYK